MSEPLPSTPPPATAPKNLSLSVGFGILCFITALYLGRDIAIPFALAMLLAFALAPIVDLLRRIRVPKLGSVTIAVTVAFSLIGIVGYVFGSQLIQLADSLPSYQTTIQEKLRSLRDSASGSGIVSRVTGKLRDLGKELSAPAQPAIDTATSSGAATPRTPVPVIIEQPPLQPFQMIGTVVGQLIFRLMQAGIVIVFVIVMLLERDDLRDRFIKLTGAGDLHKSIVHRMDGRRAHPPSVLSGIADGQECRRG